MKKAEDGQHCPWQIRHLDLEPNYRNFLSSDEFPLEGQCRPPPPPPRCAELKSKLKECLESQIVQSKLQAALRNDNVDTAAELFSETLVEACKKTGLKVQRNKTKAMSQNNWFDLESRTMSGPPYQALLFLPSMCR